MILEYLDWEKLKKSILYKPYIEQLEKVLEGIELTDQEKNTLGFIFTNSSPQGLENILSVLRKLKESQ